MGITQLSAAIVEMTNGTTITMIKSFRLVKEDVRGRGLDREIIKESGFISI